MASSISSISGVTQDQFMQLLVAQLQNQDPFEPVSSEQFISQMTSLNTLSGIQSLNANFSEMLKLQQLTQGADLIGKTVTYTPKSGSGSESGKVESLGVDNGSIFLKIGTAQVGLDQITSLKA